MNKKFELAQELYMDSRQPVLFFDKETNIVWYNSSSAAILNGYCTQDLSQVCLTSSIEAVVEKLSQGTGCHLTGNPLLGIEGIMLTPCMYGGEMEFIIGLITMRSEESSDTDLQKIVSIILAQFREPMFAIHNMLSPLKRKLEQLECYEEYGLLREISSNCYKTLRITANLSNFFRYIDQNVPMKWEVLDIDHFLTDLCLSIRQLVRRTNIRFTYQHCDESIISRIDSNKLAIAILNLVANSCLYTRPDNEIQVKLLKVQNDFIITVSDQGAGMLPEVQSHVFEPFYSYDENGSPACGVGLGLPIVKQVAELHGGSCVLTSEFNQGTTVAIRIPIVDVQSQPIVESVCEGYILRKFSPLFLYLADVCEINTIDTL